MASYSLEEVKEKLYERMVMSDEDSCWLWLGGASGNGYGAIWANRVFIPAHRASYMVHIGPIPKGMHILHKCDTPLCVNPYHLSAGTHADNLRDMANKGRSTIGERNPRAKLGEENVREIHSLRSQGYKIREIASVYGVGEAAISKILLGQRWAHVTLKEEPPNE